MRVEDTIRQECCEFHEPDVLNTYIHGGAAEVVLLAPSGKCHKYAFLRPTDPGEFPESYIFVFSVGKDHKNYIGLLDGDEFRLIKRSKFNDRTEVVRGIRYLVRMATEEELIHTTPMVAYHEGRCGRCGRKITQEQFCKRGFGKGCWRALMNSEDEGTQSVPFQ